MLSHATYPALDPHHIASQSPAIAHDLLRGELGFRGVAMTDSLEAAAVRAVTPSPGRAAVASVEAGVDLVLTTGRGSYIPVFRALVDLLAHRMIPAPALYGAESELRAQDVISRRRLWYWRRKFRRTLWLGLVLLALLGGIAWANGTDLGGAFDKIVNGLPGA